MFMPKWVPAVIAFVVGLLFAWRVLLASGRTPLPFPGHGSLRSAPAR